MNTDSIEKTIIKIETTIINLIITDLMVIITIIGSIIIEIIMTDSITITEMVEMTDSIIEDL